MTDHFTAVHKELVDIYGDGSMVASLAEHLINNMPLYAMQAEDEERTVEFQAMLTIWNWFPGGSTAEIAAGRVVAAYNTCADDNEPEYDPEDMGWVRQFDTREELEAYREETGFYD